MKDHQRAFGVVQGLSTTGEGIVVDALGTRFKVPGAMPGDEVWFRPLSKGRGRLLHREKPGPDTVDAPCVYVEQCGGCPLMRLSPAAEEAWKLKRVKDACGMLPRFHASPERLRFRIRARLRFCGAGASPVPGKGSGRGVSTGHSAPARLGFRVRGSHRVAEVDRCVVLADAVQTGLQLAREHIVPELVGTGELLLAIGRQGLPVLRIESEAFQPPNVYQTLTALVQQGHLAGAALQAAGAGVAAEFGDPCSYYKSYDGGEWSVPSGGFGQPQEPLNQLLQCRVVEMVEQGGAPGGVLELYAGSGNLTLGLVARGHPVVAVELVAPLIAAAKRNLAERGLEARWWAGAAENVPDRLLRGRDTLVLDPPREGASPALQKLSRHSWKRIVYVSCNPTTLAADLRILRDRGYEVSEAEAFDMFPHTAHVESLVRLSRS